MPHETIQCVNFDHTTYSWEWHLNLKIESVPTSLDHFTPTSPYAKKPLVDHAVPQCTARGKVSLIMLSCNEKKQVPTLHTGSIGWLGAWELRATKHLLSAVLYESFDS